VVGTEDESHVDACRFRSRSACRRSRHPAGGGRAPARPPPAGRRLSPGAGRSGPRRRGFGRRCGVMRRRPVAVYRVIDEDELLGGDGIDAPDDAAGEPARRPAPRAASVRRLVSGTGWPALPSWAVTAIAVAALAVVASLLLHRSPGAPAHAALPVAPAEVATRRAHRATAGGPPPLGTGSHAPPLTRMRAKPRTRRRRVVLRAHRARRALAARADRSPVAVPIPGGPGAGAVAAPAVPAIQLPGQEFGFER